MMSVSWQTHLNAMEKMPYHQCGSPQNAQSCTVQDYQRISSISQFAQACVLNCQPWAEAEHEDLTAFSLLEHALQHKENCARAHVANIFEIQQRLVTVTRSSSSRWTCRTNERGIVRRGQSSTSPMPPQRPAVLSVFLVCVVVSVFSFEYGDTLGVCPKMP